MFQNPFRQRSIARDLAIFAPLVMILVLTVFIYRPVAKYRFVNWDDPEYVTANADLQHFNGQAVSHFFTRFYVACYLPATMLSFALDRAIAGGGPAWFHVTNLLLHLFNICLVYWLVLALFRNRLSAVVVALLFAIHPLQAESVAWISERKNLLFVLFYLVSALSYVYYRRQGRRRYYVVSLFAFLVSCLAKATAVTLPVTLLMIDGIAGSRFPQNIRNKIPYLVLATGALAVALIGQNAFAPIQQHVRYSLLQSIAIAGHRLMATYLFRTVYPPAVPPVYHAAPQPLDIIVAAGILSLLVLAAIGWWPRLKGMTVALLFAVLNLLPGLVIINVGFTADRYFYLASLGLFYLIAQGIAGLARLANGRYANHITALFLAVIIACYPIVTRAKAAVWTDSISLWSAAIRIYPDEAEYHHKRGASFAQIDRPQQALADFDDAIKLDPNYAESLYYRAMVYSGVGEDAKALADLDRVIALAPAALAPIEMRGDLLMRRGSYQQASRDYATGLRLAPTGGRLYLKRADAEFRLGRYGQAVADCDIAVAQDPSRYQGYYLRARSFMALGREQAARNDMTTAAALGSEPARTWLTDRQTRHHR